MEQRGLILMTKHGHKKSYKGLFLISKNAWAPCNNSMFFSTLFPVLSARSLISSIYGAVVTSQNVRGKAQT